MSTQLVLLGTGGGPTPKRTRSAPANAVIVDGHAYVVDCGNGVARQLALAGVGFQRLRAAFLTHHHSDHNADYGTLLLLAWGSDLRQAVDTYGPYPLNEITRRALELHRVDIDIRIADEGRPPLDGLIRSHEIDGPGLIYEDSHVRVSTTLVDHPPFPVALAYRFDTADRSIVFSGDTAPCDALVELARGADILVHEVLYRPAIPRLVARSNGQRLGEHLLASHTASDEVGAVAKEAGVGTLVLTHLVPADDGPGDEVWAADAAKHFTGKVVVGHDLLVL